MMNYRNIKQFILSYSLYISAIFCMAVLPLTAYGQKSTSSLVINKADFESVGDKIVSMYEDEFSKRGYKVMTKADWTARSFDFRINDRDFPYVDLIYNGGPLKSKKMKKDHLSLILCHEIGHLLGKSFSKAASLAIKAGEGEADYFAAFTCLKKLWEEEKGLTLEESGLPEHEVKALLERFKQMNIDPHSEEGLKMIRIASAGYFVLTQLNNESVSFSGYDETRVKKTITDYPSAQSRLDTYLAGALNLDRPRSWYYKRLNCHSLF